MADVPSDGDASFTNTTFKVILKRTFPGALHATKLGQQCNMALGGFTRTYQRNQCSTSGPCTSTSGDPFYPQNADICCLDWSLPYQKTGVSILSRQTKETIASILMRNVYTPLNLSIVSILTIAIIVSGHLVWLVERAENPEMFPQPYLDGVDDGIWWSLVTMTT
eukprot:scaffold312179_cov46-Prasinocladus_malaysianus.AAC.1